MNIVLCSSFSNFGMISRTKITPGGVEVWLNFISTPPNVLTLIRVFLDEIFWSYDRQPCGKKPPSKTCIFIDWKGPWFFLSPSTWWMFIYSLHNLLWLFTRAQFDRLFCSQKDSLVMIWLKTHIFDSFNRSNVHSQLKTLSTIEKHQQGPKSSPMSSIKKDTPLKIRCNQRTIRVKPPLPKLSSQFAPEKLSEPQ